MSEVFIAVKDVELLFVGGIKARDPEDIKSAKTVEYKRRKREGYYKTKANKRKVSEYQKTESFKTRNQERMKLYRLANKEKISLSNARNYQMKKCRRERL